MTGSVQPRHYSRMQYWDEAMARGLPSRGYVLVVNVRQQSLQAWSRQGLCATYRISTARKGIGSRDGSYQTPPGWHWVSHRIGQGRRAGSRFSSRRYTGEVLSPKAWRAGGPQDCILTRILRLSGLEPGLNQGAGVDSFSRYIYIHGTNHEQHLGRPASHGCIRMGNKDIVELFHLIRGRPTWCWIGQLPANRRA